MKDAPLYEAIHACLIILGVCVPQSEEAQMAKARSIVRAMARKRFNERQGNAVMDDEVRQGEKACYWFLLCHKELIFGS